MKTILIVDDEYAIVSILSLILEDEGYRVVTAANVKDGLEWAKKETPDLLIVDYMMPLGNGRELIEGIRAIENQRTAPVVMMSAAARQVALSDGQGGELDVSAFLHKPFALHDLLDTVVRLIGRGDKSGTTRPKNDTVH